MNNHKNYNRRGKKYKFLYKVLKWNVFPSIGVSGLNFFYAIVMIADVAASIIGQKSSTLKKKAVSTGIKTTKEHPIVISIPKVIDNSIIGMSIIFDE